MITHNVWKRLIAGTTTVLHIKPEIALNRTVFNGNVIVLNFSNRKMYIYLKCTRGYCSIDDIEIKSVSRERVRLAKGTRCVGVVADIFEKSRFSVWFGRKARRRSSGIASPGMRGRYSVG